MKLDTLAMGGGEGWTIVRALLYWLMTMHWIRIRCAHKPVATSAAAEFTNNFTFCCFSLISVPVVPAFRYCCNHTSSACFWYFCCFVSSNKFYKESSENISKYLLAWRDTLCLTNNIFYRKLSMKEHPA